MKHTIAAASLAFIAMAASAQQRMEALHGTNETIHGVLVDAGCADRSVWNMARPAEPLAAAIAPAQAPTPAGQAVQSHGIAIDAKTVAAERQDVTPMMIQDMSTRQSDPTCALKASTRDYAVLLDSGRLLDLDSGGNTYASLAVQNSSQGRAMMNGHGPGFKPHVTVTGTVQGFRMFTNELKLVK